MGRRIARGCAWVLVLGVCLGSGTGEVYAISPRAQRNRPTPEPGVTQMAPTPTPTASGMMPVATPLDVWKDTLANDAVKRLTDELRSNSDKLEALRLQFGEAYREALKRLDAIRRGAISKEVVAKAQLDLKDIRTISQQIKDTSDELARLRVEMNRLRAGNTTEDVQKWYEALQEEVYAQPVLISYIQKAIEIVQRVGMEG